jgi:hypothetical protein
MNYLTIEALEKTFTYMDVMLSYFPFPVNDLEPALYMVGMAAMRLAVKVGFVSKIITFFGSSSTKTFRTHSFSVGAFAIRRSQCPSLEVER